MKKDDILFFILGAATLVLFGVYYELRMTRLTAQESVALDQRFMDSQKEK